MLESIIRGGTLVTAERVFQADIGIQDGVIAELSPDISEPAKHVIDAQKLHVFPGLIDTHVHFNEPGRRHWEGISSGSQALAAGGGTLFADMPLNSDPPLLTAQAFEAKLAAAKALSYTDFAFWGGLTPDNLEHLPDLAALGVIGFKAFMSDSGIPEFRAADDLTLYEGMRVASSLRLPIAVHAESQAITAGLTARLRGASDSVQAYLASRPVVAELEAIHRALFFARETGCELHIVHVSSARGLALIRESKLAGQPVSSETCPHYLHFDHTALTTKGAAAKCAPPLRSDDDRRALWQALLRGEVDIIASDHSPSDPALKQSGDMFAVWGGVAGVQSTLNVVLTHQMSQGLPLRSIAALTATNAAERFRLPHKGRLEVGYHADFCLVDIAESFTLQQAQLYYHHKFSPYLGERLRGRIRQTWLRGKCIYQDGQFAPAPQGRLIKPQTG
jgi:allantoinase